MSVPQESNRVSQTDATNTVQTRIGATANTRTKYTHKLGAALIGALLLLALGQVAPAYAANITVEGTTCTLINAITAANSDSATGGCTAGSGADTLVLASNATHTLTASNNTSSDSINNRPSAQRFHAGRH